ncbi:MAG: TetR/AcrR family transcriptional regulator [Halieaceae bacterium]|nr:TetR/AcrR family transcriptional regulator [Halieaceae bacterium]
MSKALRRPVGRPRANKQVPRQPAREDILAASAELFAEHGFKGTSTRMIAERVGIRQPSLFHHFSRKADILEALVDVGGQRILDYLDRIDFAADPRVQLYQLIAFDCHFLLTEPLGINKLMALPEVRNGPLGVSVDATRERILDAYRRLIAAGEQQGYFLVQDLDVVTHTVFGMGESVWSWCAGGVDDPQATACIIADMALRTLLLDSARLPEVRESAEAIHNG